MRNLPADIEVLEPSAGAARELRFRLPIRTHESVKQHFWQLTIAAIVMALIPIAFSLFLATMFYLDEHKWPGSLWLPMALFGSPLLPLAVLVGFYAVNHRWSKCLLTCTARQLKVGNHLGPIGWTRRLPLAGLKGLRVQIGPLQVAGFSGSAPFNPHSGLRNAGTLYADYEQAPCEMICSGYASEWLLPVADELTRSVQSISSSAASLLPVTLTHEDARVIIERAEQPSTSNARVHHHKDLLVIEHPARGWWRGWPRILSYGCVFGISMLLLWTVFLLSGSLLVRLESPVKFQPMPIWLGLLMTSPFYAIGLCVTAVWYGAARYTARWEIAPHELRLWQRTLFGERIDVWPRTDLQAIRIVSKEVSRENDFWTTCLQIQSSSQPPLEIFRTYDKSEVEWLATTLCKAVDLPFGSVVERELEKK